MCDAAHTCECGTRVRMQHTRANAAHPCDAAHTRECSPPPESSPTLFELHWLSLCTTALGQTMKASLLVPTARAGALSRRRSFTPRSRTWGLVRAHVQSRRFAEEACPNGEPPFCIFRVVLSPERNDAHRECRVSWQGQAVGGRHQYQWFDLSAIWKAMGGTRGTGRREQPQTRTERQM